MAVIKRIKLPNHYDKARRYGQGYLILPDPLDPPRRARTPAEIGREVTWTEGGAELAGQVWDRAEHAAWWVVVAPEHAAFPGELRTAWIDGEHVTVHAKHYTPGGAEVAPAELAEAA